MVVPLWLLLFFLAASCSENGDLLLSVVVDKSNQRNTKQSRVMCITSLSIQFLNPGNYSLLHPVPMQNVCCSCGFFWGLGVGGGGEGAMDVLC